MGQGVSRASAKAGKRLRYENKVNPTIADVAPQNPSANTNRVGPSVGENQPQKESLDSNLSPLAKDVSNWEPRAVEEDFDPILAGFLDQIGSSIQTRKVLITDPKQMARRKPEGTQTKRLDTKLLRCLFEDTQSPKFQDEGGKIAVQKLAEEYGVDAKLLESVLKFNAVPVIREDKNGSLFASLPNTNDLSKQIPES